MGGDACDDRALRGEDEGLELGTWGAACLEGSRLYLWCCALRLFLGLGGLLLLPRRDLHRQKCDEDQVHEVDHALPIGMATAEDHSWGAEEWD